MEKLLVYLLMACLGNLHLFIISVQLFNMLKSKTVKKTFTHVILELFTVTIEAA